MRNTLPAVLVFALCSPVGCSGSKAPTLDDIVYGCAAMSACLGSDLNFCIAFAPLYTAQDSKTLPCARRAAGDCTKVAACLGFKPTGQSCDMQSVTTCSGSSVTGFCRFKGNGAGKAFSIDCAAEGGLMCLSAPHIGPSCVEGTCSSTTTLSRSCDGDRLIECAFGLKSPLDCSTFGLHCVTTGTVAFCGQSSPAPTCTRGTAPTCDGNTLVNCVDTGGDLFGVPPGRESRIDCNALIAGSSCKNGACVVGNGCPMADVPNGRCDGDTAVICVSESEYRIDCKQLGFATCSAQGDHITVGASCVF
jgi:hypothetical protein